MDEVTQKWRIFLREDKNNSYQIFCDMDGVLVDLAAGILKEAELLNDRINTLSSIESYVGTYFSKQYVLMNVLRMNEKEIEEIMDQISSEAEAEAEAQPDDEQDTGDEYE